MKAKDIKVGNIFKSTVIKVEKDEFLIQGEPTICITYDTGMKCWYKLNDDITAIKEENV